MAVHVLALLGRKNGEPVCSEVLATSINTNPVVVRRLLRALQEAKLVETRKGAGFGSRLSRPAHTIDLGQVFRAVECETPFAMPRRKPNARCAVGKSIGAALEGIFGSARQAMEGDLARTSLAEVLAIVEQGARAGQAGTPKGQATRAAVV
jgi:DNA-binding IscR family transcriptional regulator